MFSSFCVFSFHDVSFPIMPLFSCAQTYLLSPFTEEYFSKGNSLFLCPVLISYLKDVSVFRHYSRQFSQSTPWLFLIFSGLVGNNWWIIMKYFLKWLNGKMFKVKKTSSFWPLNDFQICKRVQSTQLFRNKMRFIQLRNKYIFGVLWNSTHTQNHKLSILKIIRNVLKNKFKN